MSITRIAREIVWARARKDASLREVILTEAINEMLAGDFGAGKAMLHDYVNATITFDRLAERLGKSSKSVQRALGPRGSLTVKSLFDIIKVLRALERIRLVVRNNQTRRVSCFRKKDS